MLVLILLLIATILFVLASNNTASSRFQLLPLGLAFQAAALIAMVWDGLHMRI